MSDNTFDPTVHFPHFYNNPVIQKLGERRAWAISDNDKRPINIQKLVHDNVVVGASYKKPDTDLVTLHELTRDVPEAANCAYYLDNLLDGYFMIDIEPSCDTHTRDRLLKLVDFAEYTEVSMSGRGYHLLIRKPSNFYAFGDLVDNMPYAIKDPHGGFEILMRHWVTYTRQPIPAHVIPAEQHGDDLWCVIFSDLVASQPRIAKGYKAHHGTLENINTDDLDALDTQPTYTLSEPDQAIVDSATDFMTTLYRKTLSDFNNDMSRYEFSQLRSIIQHIGPLVYAEEKKHKKPSLDQPAATILTRTITLSFIAAQQVITYRPKHSTYRSGRPYLLSQIMSVVDSNKYESIIGLTRKSRKAKKPKELPIIPTPQETEVSLRRFNATNY